MFFIGSADRVRVWQRIQIRKQIEPSREIFWGICNKKMSIRIVLQYIQKYNLKLIQPKNFKSKFYFIYIYI